MLTSKSNVNTQNSFYFSRLVFWRSNLKIKPENKWIASLVGDWHCLIDLRVKEIEILLPSPQFENSTVWTCHFKATSLTFLSSHIAIVEIQQWCPSSGRVAQLVRASSHVPRFWVPSPVRAQESTNECINEWDTKLILLSFSLSHQ